MGSLVPLLLALATLLPFGLAGLFFTKRGLALSIKSDDRQKKDVGYANLVLGSIILIIGLLVVAFAYARMS